MNIELSDELRSKVVQSAEKPATGEAAADSAAEVVRKMEELGYLDYGLDI